MKQIYAFMLLLGCITGIYSQSSSNPLSDQGTEIIIDRLPENDFFYTHTFEKGQTIYSLARIFNTSVKSIFDANGLSAQTPISVGQTVMVPFTASSIFTESSSFSTSTNKYIPIYYIAKPKETLYGIAKTYFNQAVDIFAKRNKIQGTNIAIGQKLLVGWVASPGSIFTSTPENNIAIQNLEFESEEPITPESLIQKKETAVPNPDNIKDEIANASTVSADSMSLVESVDSATVKVLPTTITKKSRGIAIWERDSQVNNMAVALHYTAKRNSIIEIYNPQLGLSTKAKVIGPIPSGTYPSDVTLIVSKKVAESVGALDTRFMVDLTYQEAK